MTSSVPYKGLTIRFGADTTQFTTRMTALNKVIGGTQTKLNQLTKAMRGDPSSVTLLGEKFLYLREQVANAAVRVDTLRRGVASMRADGVTKLAEGARETALAYQRADAAVKRVDKELNDQYTRLREIGQQVGKTFDKKKLSEFTGEILASSKVSKELKDEVTAIASKVVILKARWEEMDKAREAMSKNHEFKTMATELAIARSELNQFASQTVDAKQKLLQMSRDGAQRMEALGNEFKELKSESGSLESQFRNLSTAIHKNTSDTAAYNQAVNIMAERVRNAKRQVEVLTEELRMRQAQTGIERVSESMTELTQKVSSARQKAEMMERVLARYKGFVDTSKQAWESLDGKIRASILTTEKLTDTKRKSLGITEQEEQAYRNLARVINQSSEKVRELEQRAEAAEEELEMREAIAAQKKLQGEINEAGSKMTALTTKTKMFGTAAKNAMRDFATGMGATFAPAIMMAGMRIITAGDQIDSAFRDMRKTVEGTEADFQHLHDAAIEFSKTHPVSADTILEIEALGGQLGICVENLEQFATVVSNLDIATNMNSEDIALNLGKLANILHLTVDEYENFADSLVRLGNSEPALESDIMKITTRFSGMAAIVGVLPDEILAISTAATATGQKAEAAGSSLQRTFGRIEGAVAGVTQAMLDLEEGTEEDWEAFETAQGKLEAYAQVAHMSADEFKALWENNERLETGITGTTTAFKAFIEGLQKIDEEGGSVDGTLQALGITGVRDRQLLEGLTRTTKVLDDSLLMSRDAWYGVADQWGAAGDAAREADKKAQGFSGKLQMLKNTAQAMGDAFASKLLPLMDKLLDAFKLAAKVIEDMDEGVAEAITIFGGFLIALAPVMRMVSQTSITFGALKVAFTDAAIANKGLAVASGDATKALAAEEAVAKKGGFKSLISSLGGAKVAAVALAVAGIALVVKAIIDYQREQEKMRKVTVGMKELFYKTGEAAESEAGSIEDNGKAFRKCADDVKKLYEEHEKLYEQMQSDMEEAKVSTKVMEKYAEVLKENIGASKDDKLAVQKLNDAVKKLNEQYGLGLEVVELDGKMHVTNADDVDLNTQAIDKLIDAKKREIEVNAIANMQAQLIEQQIRDELALAEAKKNTALAQDEYNQAMQEGGEGIDEYARRLAECQETERMAQDAYNGSTEAIRALDGTLTRATEATDMHGQRIKELASEYPLLADRLDDVSDHAFGQFIDALEQAGYGTEDLQNLTASEIDKMVEAWSSGSGHWIDYMEKASGRMTADGLKTSERIVASFNDMKDKSIKRISEMTQISEEELRKLADEAGIDSEAAMDAWVKGIEKAKSESEGAAELNVDAVKKIMEDAKEKTKGIGFNVGSGFASGIKSTIDLVAQSARDVVAQAIAAANDEAATASPSKKTMWTGEMMGEGYVVGMEKEEDAVRKQGELLANLALGAGYSGSGNYLGNMSRMAAAAIGGTTSNTTNNSTTNEYFNVTMNVEAHDLQDMRTVDDFLGMLKQAKRQYA